MMSPNQCARAIALVMRGLDPRIHVAVPDCGDAWMAGTSPAMTVNWIDSKWFILSQTLRSSRLGRGGERSERVREERGRDVRAAGGSAAGAVRPSDAGADQ